MNGFKEIHPGLVVWFTGLPASGKSTWARHLSSSLKKQGVGHLLLDGDDVRARLHPELGFGQEDRDQHYLVLARLAAYLAEQSELVLVAATAHQREYRRRARKLSGQFLEVYVDTPPAICHARDPKNLYRQADATQSSLPGVGELYEAPETPDFRICTTSADESAVLVELHAKVLRSLNTPNC